MRQADKGKGEDKVTNEQSYIRSCQVCTETGEIKLEYQLLSDSSADNPDFFVYGTQVSMENGQECETAQISDVTASKSEMRHLIDLFCDLEVTPVTLNDIIQDFIAN